jgi:hypothetical protein
MRFFRFFVAVVDGSMIGELNAPVAGVAGMSVVVEKGLIRLSIRPRHRLEFGMEAAIIGTDDGIFLRINCLCKGPLMVLVHILGRMQLMTIYAACSVAASN